MWQGRDDGDDIIHNRVFKCLDKNSQTKLLGFCSDMGVERNKGRVGSKNAPKIIRKSMANFAVFDDFCFDDLGDIENFDTLENADKILYQKLFDCIANDNYCVVLGGGHETSLSGINAIIDSKKSVGVINFDAHFDVRKQDLHTSGNSFYNAYMHAKQNGCKYNYLCVGANKLANTKALFDTMEEMNASYVLDSDFDSVENAINDFIKQNDFIYLSIDVDVFSYVYAPGVSAPSVYGIALKDILKPLKILLDSNKVLLADICEFNPVYDIDGHTAKLCAYLAYFLLRKGNI